MRAMPLIRNPLQKCLLQAVFMGYWKQDSEKNDAYTSDPYEFSPSLMRLLSDAMLRLPVKDVGIFFSTLRKAAALLLVFIIQHPTQSELTSYCRDLDFAIQSACPHPAVRAFNSAEIASLLLVELDRRFRADPKSNERANMLLLIDSEAKVVQTQRFMMRVTHDVFALIIRVYGPLARQHMSFKRFFDISCSFRPAELAHGEMPCPTLGMYLEADMAEDEHFRPVKEPIPLAMFCETAWTVARDATCSVCICGMSDHEAGNEKPVVTKCGHVFHEACLDTWVNKSCMTASNTCPACRAEMCAARDRELVTLDG